MISNLRFEKIHTFGKEKLFFRYAYVKENFDKCNYKAQIINEPTMCFFFLVYSFILVCL